VCRELTKLHEEIRRGAAAELAEYYAENAPRGEVVLVVGAAGSASNDPAARGDALAALHALVEAGARPRPAAKAVSNLTGVAANELYGQLMDDA
jgi:16S rRNA (cytidine1402-2'-O)-methyltransferase